MYYSGQAIQAIQAIQHMFVTTQLAGSADAAPNFVIDHFLCFDVAEPRGTLDAFVTDMLQYSMLFKVYLEWLDLYGIDL